MIQTENNYEKEVFNGDIGTIESIDLIEHEVSIRFDLMRKDIEERRRNQGEVAKGDYQGTVSKTDQESHFTQIFLTNIRGEAQVILAGVADNEFVSGKKALYGLSAESTAKILTEKANTMLSLFYN